jgi:hypothetical protein
MEYKFINTKTKYGSQYNLVKVEQPYDFLSMIFEGNERSEDIQKIIDGINEVKSGAKESYYFGNDNGFTAVATSVNFNNEEKEGVRIYDAFGQSSDKEFFIVSFTELLNILQDFKEFIK